MMHTKLSPLVSRFPYAPRINPLKAALVSTLLAGLLCFSASPATTQQPTQPSISTESTSKATLRGTVLDARAMPVDHALLRLVPVDAGPDSAPVETMTDGRGSFTFSKMHRGRYKLIAAKAGLGTKSRSVTVTTDVQVILELNLEHGDVASSDQGPTSTPPDAAMEFSDKPNFTVAGITDWTAVGGHGSDSTLRTSEALARETSKLKQHSTAETITNDAGENDSTEEPRLRAALVSTPRSYAANHNLGEYYLHAARYRQAIPLLEAASAINHDQAADEYALALACRGVGDVKQASQHIEKALQGVDTAEFHRLAGEIDEERGDPLGAVRQEELAARMEPSEENYFTWGSELLLHRAIWQAAEVFKQGALSHPRSARMRSAWGAALFAGALYDEAAQRLCEASDLSPDDPEPYLLLGQVDIAAPSPLPCVEQKLARLVNVQPDNATATYLYAMSIAKREARSNLPLVRSLLTRAVTLDPRYADAYLQLGILSSAQGDDTEAVRLFEKVAALDPQLAEVHYRLGLAYDRKGETTNGAREFLLHDELLKAQADAVEKQRRELKQFSVVLEH